MENKIKAPITKLQRENQERSTAMNDGHCSIHRYAVLAHQYNNILGIIKQLEEILN